MDLRLFCCILLMPLCYAQSKDELLSNSKNQPAGLTDAEIIPEPQAQTQNRDPFPNNNFFDTDNRIREEQERERDLERDRNQFPFGNENGNNNFDPFGRTQRPLNPFSRATTTTTTQRNFRVSDFNSNQQRPQTSINPGFGNPFGLGIVRNSLIREPRYFVVASKIVRPGQVYRVAVTIFKTQTQTQEIEVRASLLRDGVDLGSDTKVCQPNTPETLMIRVPKTSIAGDYRLRVEGNDNGLVGGTAFVNETQLRFSERSMTIFIQTDKPVYMQGQTVRFRVVPINTALRAFDDGVDVYMIDPRGNIVGRWLSRQSSFGAISLNYTLSDQPSYGNYSIRVHALQQIEEKEFWVEEFYQPRFEVNVTMPAFLFTSDSYISGFIVANFTSGAPVKGNLTIKATMRPIDERLAPTFRTSLYEPAIELFIPNFQGYFEFRFGMWEIASSVPQLNDIEVTVTAQVGEYYWNEVIEGYSKARIYNSSLRLEFLGGSPQVFKPSMPYTCYVTVSYIDGSPLSTYRLFSSNLEIDAEVITKGGGRRRLEPRNIAMIPDHPGIWKVTFDLKKELTGSQQTRQSVQIMNDIASLRVVGVYTNQMQESATAELLAVAHFSPRNRHIFVSSSTSSPKVGEYIVFHVRGNFYMDRFTFLIMSKGVILLSGSETMDTTLRTFAIPVSPEMAPAATIVVYHVTKYMEVVADSMTYPCNGISRNNFTVKINNRKEKTNNLVEIIIRGQPGAYVGLSGIDSSFYTMQAGNELSYSEILEKMINFDEDSNGTLTHKWISRDGFPDEIAYFPSHSFGIDVNRTFEYTGLVVFSDIVLPRRLEFCNETAGQYACLTGNQCYHIERKCDGLRDCADGTDESNCPWFNATDLIHFKLHRFNRLQRLYDNTWLWKDINIGPHGHFIVTVPVPERPALWMVSSFGISSKFGFGLLKHPIVYSGVRPLFMNVEMPLTCRQGEQIGIRITIFNYMMRDIEVMVVLANSPYYKFIHVDSFGSVQSYNPRTSTGEHQHLVWIRAQDAVQVHMPIVPTVLGDVSVSIRVVAQIAQDHVTRTIHVEPDGVPQYRHTSVLLDLSSRAFVLQYMHINVTESPIIPYDFDRYYVYSSNLADISVVGDVIGPAFPTMPVNASSLLNKPMESAEQNMFSFAANLYTLMYLRLTNQRNKTVYREAFHNLNVAYQRQLSFQHEDGSFSYFRSDWNNSSPSVWVTAYCSRVFSEATFNEWENFLFIDPNVIAKSIDWLLQFQTEEGSFYEVSPYANRKLNDTVFYNGFAYTPNITLTAHVLIALQNVKDLPGVIGPRLAVARQKAVNYLEIKIDSMRYGSKPYEIAVVTYALMLNKSPKSDAAFIILQEHARYEGGLAYWGREKVPVPDFKLENNKPFLLPRLPHKYDSENIEATAYALLVYVARQELMVDPIVRWLNTQRLYDGGWASTQDTAAAMRGLIDYTIRSNIRNVTDLTVTIEAVSVPDRVVTFRINSEHLARPKKLHIENAYGAVKIQAKGAGFAILQMHVQYGVDRNRFVTEPPAKAFALQTYGKFYGRNASYIEYHSCQSWTYLEESERSGMAVLEVKIPTGYFVLQTRLDQYVLSNLVPTLRRAKYYPDKVVMYFDYLEVNPTCVNFTIERWFPVANMTRYLPVRVYDYYAPERFNETIFDAFDVYILDICQVCGSYQCPYCPIFAGSMGLNPSIPVILLSTIVFLVSSSLFSSKIS